VLSHEPARRGRALAAGAPPAAAAAAAAAAATRARAASAGAYCQPTDACWPTPAQWATLNASLGGILLAVAPPLAPCAPWGAPSNPAACAAIAGNFSNSYLRASLPGAQQEINWEQDPATGAACFDTARPCLQGAVPPYAVPATRDAHLAAALAFAAAHRLRVVVKSSGHEYQGRSTGAAALLLWTHALQGAAYEADFAACPAAAPAPAVHTRPGTSWGQVYALADAARVTVVGGSEVSVSSCGGYTLGGGHSWMGPAYGMASDNALRFTAVLANGTSVTASACENEDLFWALRGGGGGTLAVVTSCTYAARPFPAGGAAGAFVTVKLLQGPASMAVLLDGFMAYAASLSTPALSAGEGGVVAGGYFIPSAEAAQVSFLLGFNGTVQQANAALAPLAAWVATQPQHLGIASSTVTPFPSLMAFHESFDPASEATGNIVTLGSRLLPAALLAQGAPRAALAGNLTAIAYALGGFTGLFVCGGEVAAPTTSHAAAHPSSLNPAWRAAGLHVVWGAGWAANASLAEQGQVLAGVSALTDGVRAGTPGSGAYWSESDFLEPQWQEAFWGGEHYARLQGVKAAYDPAGVLGCHHCVELPGAAA